MMTPTARPRPLPVLCAVFLSLGARGCEAAPLVAKPFLEAPAGSQRRDVPPKNTENTPDRPLKILPVGDSLTAGFNVTGGYRSPLQKLLKDAGCSFEFVGSRNDNSDGMTNPQHSGYSGYNVVRIAPVAMADLKTYRPDVMLLMIGTNVMNQSDGPAGSKQLDALIGQITTAYPKMPLIVATIPPIIPPGYFKNIPDAAPVEAFNASVRLMVAAHSRKGERVALADVFAALSPSDIDPNDKTHFLQSGADKVAQVWFQALQRQAFLSLQSQVHASDKTP